MWQEVSPASKQTQHKSSSPASVRVAALAPLPLWVSQGSHSLGWSLSHQWSTELQKVIFEGTAKNHTDPDLDNSHV